MSSKLSKQERVRALYGLCFHGSLPPGLDPPQKHFDALMDSEGDDASKQVFIDEVVKDVEAGFAFFEALLPKPLERKALAKNIAERRYRSVVLIEDFR